MLVLGRSQVEALLDVDSLIDALAPAMADLTAGRASVPDRVAALVPDRDGFLAAMPGFLPSAGALMTKLVSLFPHNDGARLPTHQALIVAFDPDTGEPAALLDGTAITAARTGACSALSVRLLAREDATVLAVLGTGVQARSHARAICRVRPIRQIRVAGRDPAKAAALAEELSAALEGDVRAVSSYAEALDGADIAAATTHTVEPVIRRSWLTPGVHITSVGYNPAGREIDDATVTEALVCVESRQAVLAPLPAGSNDLLMPIRNGLITADHVHAELGELITGNRPGRTTLDQITLYKSVGVAAQDAAATALVLASAREQSIGEEITLR
ncbi:ornithine cyclodeaminase family protein [Streptomyces doebereineriae]|uniref:Ornithine cyclodeaminase family protein n=1 Tax=Streptomyces doebereineriae TaxID=3075528 RepID=A0ABU2VJS3_9ACTN|nr:ornithine cyclodeaminase family protein [Streptomyces sp. DSM 41640]MDT0485386.1 ornithine cyclodeaminase family protein [Streptomyces sp. DSM 41640]